MQKIVLILAVMILLSPTLVRAGSSKEQQAATLHWGVAMMGYEECDFSKAMTIGNSTDIHVAYSGETVMGQKIALLIFDSFQRCHPELRIVGKQELYVLSPANSNEIFIAGIRIDHEAK